MTTRVTLQPAVVLHTRLYGDTSRLVDLLTLEHGRISGIARGVRSNRSKSRGLLQPFVPLLVSWSGKTDLMSLGKIEGYGIAYDLCGAALLSGLYLNELLVRLLHRHDSHPGVYRLYLETLSALDLGKNIEPVLRQFEIRLLAEIGYGIELTHDIHGKPLEPAARYLYHRGHGLECVTASLSHAPTFSGETLLALHRGDFTDTTILRETKRLTRFCLAELLGEKPIKSRELFL